MTIFKSWQQHVYLFGWTNEGNIEKLKGYCMANWWNHYKNQQDGTLKGDFLAADSTVVPDGMKFVESIFVHYLKKAGVKWRNESRLIAQNYSDEIECTTATKAPTVRT